MVVTAAPPPDSGAVLGEQGRRRTGLTARFLQAVGQEIGADVLTPAALARAVVRVLPVDAAGMSTLMSVLRLPLGSSSDAAARAEELQTTLGDGPCLGAAEAQASLIADFDDLTRRWPLYTDELTAKTPFRSVAAIALHSPGHGVFAALDLFSTEPRLRDRLDVHAIDRHIAAPAAALLSTCLDEVSGDLALPDAAPGWYQTAAGRRHDVWVAIGMAMSRRPRRTSDALSLLRAQAFTQDRSLDDLAADIVARRVPLDDSTG
jgi:hypothetical protein